MAFDLSQQLFGVKDVFNKVTGANQPRPSVQGTQDNRPTQGPQNFIGPQNNPNPGGGGGGGGTSSNSFNPNAFFEQTKESGPKDTSGQDNDFINSSFAPAIANLDAFMAQLAAQQPGLIGAEQQRGENLRGQALGEQESAQGQLGQQQIEARQTRDSSVNQARRQGAEGLQGLQSKFGGASGTGGFVGELLQRDVARNIGEQNVAFQNSLAKIQQAESDLQRNVQNIISNIEANTQDAVNQLKSGFDERIFELNQSRVGLERDKAQAKIDLVQQFRAKQDEINERNAQLKQSLLMKAAEAQGQFDNFKGESARTVQDTIAFILGQGGEIDKVDGSEFVSGDLGQEDPGNLRIRLPGLENEDDPNSENLFDESGVAQGIVGAQ